MFPEQILMLQYVELQKAHAELLREPNLRHLGSRWFPGHRLRQENKKNGDDETNDA
jgi:hypothetical protein